MELPFFLVFGLMSLLSLLLLSGILYLILKPVSSRRILERLNQNLLWKGLWVSWKSRGKPEVGKIRALGASGRLEVLLPSGASIEIPETVRTLEPMDPKSEP